MRKTYMWKGERSLERLELRRTSFAIEARGIVTGYSNEKFFTSEYELYLNRKWEVKKVQLRSNLSKKGLQLCADNKANWFDGHGTRIMELNGCMDVDISITPFTNSLPICRLKPVLNKKQDLQVVFIDGVFGDFKKVTQGYQRLSPCQYRYEGRSGLFKTIITVDEEDLIIEYPGLFHRVEEKKERMI